jgi:hypothetical protein
VAAKEAKKKKDSSADVASTRRRTTSTRASSAVRSRSSVNAAQKSMLLREKLPQRSIDMNAPLMIAHM